MHRVTQVSTRKRFRLTLTFEDGVTGIANLSDILDDNTLARLSESGLFEQVRIDAAGGLDWDGKVGLNPALLYKNIARKKPSAGSDKAKNQLVRTKRNEQENPQFALLHELSNELSRTETFDDLCRKAVELAREKLGIPRISLWFLDNTDHVRGSYGTSETGETVDERDQYYPVDEILHELLSGKKRLRFETGAALFSGSCSRVGTGSSVTIPLWDGETAIGTLNADDLRAPGSLTREKAEILALYAVTVGHLCSRRRAEDAAHQLSEGLTILHQVTNQLSLTAGVEELCYQAVELGRSNLGFSRLSIWLVEGHERKDNLDSYRMRGTFGTSLTGETVDERDWHNDHDTLFGKMTSTGERLYYASDCKLFNRQWEEIGRGTRAVALLWDGVRAIGVLCADDLLDPGSLSQNKVEMLGYLAVTLGHLLSRKQNEESAINLSERLTTLHQVTNDLSRIDSFDDLCRTAVELGRSQLGFSRLGLWFFDGPVAKGSFGTSDQGEITDERHIQRPIQDELHEVIQEGKRLKYKPKEVLCDGRGCPKGEGAFAIALMWDGSKVIGAIGADDLLAPGSLTHQQAELLSLYASSLGHLCSRKRAEEAANDFSRQLAVLHEVSNELSLARTIDELSRKAVDLGRAKLGFSRLSIWFWEHRHEAVDTPAHWLVTGAYGTSATGETVDERHIKRRLASDGPGIGIVRGGKRLSYTQNVELHDGDGHRVGQGNHATALLWNGADAMGAISADDLLAPNSLTRERAELLALYAATVGHLCARKRAEETAISFSDKLTALQDVSNELLRAQSFDELCRSAVELGRSRLGFSRLSIWLIKDESIIGTFGTSVEGQTVDERLCTIPYDEAFRQILQDKSRLRYVPNSVLQDSHNGQVGKGTHATALLWNGEIIIGALCADDCLAPGSLTEKQAELLAQYAATLGHLCSRKKSEESAAHFNAQLTTLHEIANELALSDTSDELCRLAVELGRRRLGFPRIGIWFLEHCKVSGQVTTLLRGSFGTSKDGTTTDERLIQLPFSGALEEVVQGRRRLSYDVNQRLDDGYKIQLGVGTRAIAPLWDGSEVIGAVCADDLLSPGALTPEQGDILALYAPTIAHLYSRKKVEEATAHFSRQLTTLHEVSNELARTNTSDELCRQAISMGRTRLGFSRLGIWFLEPVREHGQTKTLLRGSFGTSLDGETTDERDIRHPFSGVLEEVVQGRRRLSFKMDQPLDDGELNRLGMGTQALAPLWDGSEIIGALGADDLLAPGSLTPEQGELLVLYAATIAHLYSRKKAEEVAGQFSRQLTILHELSNELALIGESDEICRQAVELGRKRLGFSRLSIWFLERSSQSGEAKTLLRGAFGTSATGVTTDERDIRLPFSGVLEEVIQGRRRLSCETNQILDDCHLNHLGRGTHALAPLWDGSEIIGALGADDLLAPGSLTPEQCEVLVLYAATIAHLYSRKKNEETAARFGQQLTTLHEVSNELARVASSEELCRQAVELGRSRLNFPRLSIWFLEPAREEGELRTLLRGSFGTSESGETTDERGIRHPFSGALEEVVQGRRRLSYDPLQRLDDANVSEVGFGAHAIAPLWDGSEVVGAICADDLLAPGALTVEQGEMLALYAATIGHLYSRKKVEESAAKFSRQLTTLHQVGNELSRAKTFDDLCRMAVELGRNRLGFSRLGIWFLEGTDRIRGSFGTADTGEITDERHLVLPSGDISDALALGGKRVYYSSGAELRDGANRTLAIGSHAAAALWDGEVVVGSISADDLLNPGSLTETQAELLALYAATLGHLCSRKRAEEVAARFSQQLAALHQLSNQLSRAKTFDDLCRMAVELGRSRLGFSRLGIWFLEGPDKIRGSFGTSDDGETTDERHVLLPSGDISDALAHGGKRVYYTNGAALRDGEHHELATGSHAAAALWDGEVVVGSISADDMLNPGSLTETQAELLALYATTLGHLCSRKRAEEATARFSQQLAALHEVSNELSLADSLDDMCRLAVELGRRRLGFSRLSMWFIDDPNSNLIRGSFGTSMQGETIDERGLQHSICDTYFSIIREGKRLSYEKAAPILDGQGNEIGSGTRALALMWDGSEVIGSMAADDFLAPGSLTEEQAEVLALYAATVAHLCSSKIAEQKRLNLERQVQHAQKLESLGVLAGGIAHDFNNILMAVLGYADLALQDLSETHPAQASVREIEKGAKRAAQLAKQMLAYSGKGRFVIDKMDLSILIDDMAHLLRTSIARTITLNLNLDRTLPHIEADAAQMQQVVMNLITNAAEAIGDTFGTISLSTGQMACTEEYLSQSLVAPASQNEHFPTGTYVYFEVSDTGCGMDEETQSRIFEPFFTTKFTGRGLGMAAVLGIVRSHRGAIMLTTALAQGTTFKILFPAVAGALECPVELKQDEPRKSEPPQKATILVVDDEEVLRKLTKTVLERHGFTVLTAADGFEGVQVFQQHAAQVDCVLLDLTMPHMDGELCFEELRRIRKDVKVILSSGYSEQEATQRFRGKELAGFIQKPYQPTALYEQIQNVLG